MSSSSPVSLRVMRLCQPSLAVLPAGSLGGVVRASGGDGEASGVGGGGLDGTATAVTLPEGFGSIFVGQTFGSYISVENCSTAPLEVMSITAELQTEGARRVALVDKRVKAAGGTDTKVTRRDFQPTEMADMVIEQPLTERGEHILRVCITHTDPFAPSGTKSFRKFYRFQVTDPFKFSHRSAPLASETLVEFTLQSAVPFPLTLREVTFATPDCFVATEIAAAATVDTPESTDATIAAALSRIKLLKPGESTSFAFRLAVAEGHTATAKSATELGRAVVSWSATFGEAGWWRSAPAVRKIPQRPAVELELHDMVDRVGVGESFKARCTIRNRTEAPLDLRLVSVDSFLGGGVEIDGMASKNIGVVEPRKTAECELCLFGRTPGLHAVRGLAILDVATSRVVSTTPGLIARGAARAAAAGPTGQPAHEIDEQLEREGSRVLGTIYVVEEGETDGTV